MHGLGRWLAAACCVAIVTAARAQDQPENEAALLQLKYEARLMVWQQTETEDGRDWDNHPARQFAPRFQALAEKYAGRPEGLEALQWLLQNVYMAFTISWGEENPPLVALARQLTRDYAADPAIADVMDSTSALHGLIDDGPLFELYDKVLAENPSRVAQRRALFCKAVIMYEKGRRGGAGQDEQRAAARNQALALFKQVVEKFPDTPGAKSAQGYVFELENLQIGMKAPDFIGRNEDGREIRLSDFRGRVVVIDFWGFW